MQLTKHSAATTAVNEAEQFTTLRQRIDQDLPYILRSQSRLNTLSLYEIPHII